MGAFLNFVVLLEKLGEDFKNNAGHISGNCEKLAPHNDDARTDRLRQETYATLLGMGHSLASLNVNNFVVYGQKNKVWVLVFLVRTSGTFTCQN